MNCTLNIYGDQLVQAAAGRGADIATQRVDDLDRMALDRVADLRTECFALDVACGLGGQAIRLAKAGAQVIAADIADLGTEVIERAKHAGVATRVSFIKTDLRYLNELIPDRAFDIICCQRAIHYLPWHEAVPAVGRLALLLKPGGRIYLSASGIDSELGSGYSGCGLALSERYRPLAENMATKHGIEGPVCLYFLEDLESLFLAVGLVPLKLYASEFCNVKGVAFRAT